MMHEESFIATDNLYFFDSYALIELFKGNKNYAKYTKFRPVLTKLNLFEVYHFFLKEGKEKAGNNFIHPLFLFAQDYPLDVIKAAAKLRATLNQRDLSMTDCVGYCFAKFFGIKFLTGDKQFEDMDNVEFVK